MTLFSMCKKYFIQPNLSSQFYRVAHNCSSTANGSPYTKQSTEKQLDLPPSPKKPIPPYVFFIREQSKKLKGMSLGDISKEVARRWQNLPEVQRKILNDNYQKQVSQYYDEFYNYVVNLSSEQKQLLDFKEIKLFISIKKEQKRIAMEQLGRPKRSENCLLLFASTLAKPALDTPKVAFLKYASEQWKNLPESKRIHYRKEAERLRKEYLLRLEMWEEKMIKEGRTDFVRQRTLDAVTETDDSGTNSERAKEATLMSSS